MQALPHHYMVAVQGKPEDNLTVSVDNLPGIKVTPPLQFGGPGDQWSPEELMMAAVANCFVLTFKAIAKPSKLRWISIHCETEGILDKDGREIKFTEVTTTVKLTIAKE